MSYSFRVTNRNTPNRNTEHLFALRDGRPLSCGATLEAWRTDPAARAALTEVLADPSLEAFFWETPPWTRATLDRPFECVRIGSPALAACRPDPRPFAMHLSRKGPSVRFFPSLGGDTLLIVPVALGRAELYPHLGAFLRGAPAEQVDLLWETTASQLSLALEQPGPRWLSTSGLGVAWLHVRIDTRPKYYSHAAYRV